MKNRAQTGIIWAMLLAAGLLAAIPFARAAKQGSPGTSSTGTATITVTIPPQYQISGMQDLPLGTYGGTGGLSGNTDICVFSNGDGGYQVRIYDDSTMSPSGFSVQNPQATASIPYEVKWNDRTGTSGNSPVSYNAAASQTGANTQSTDCSLGGKSANLEVQFASSDLRAAPTGYYDATLTVVIQP